MPDIERAVTSIEPLLKQISGYPSSDRKPVSIALKFTRCLAASVPGPVLINRESYAKDT
jgi:hypothetical protein